MPASASVVALSSLSIVGVVLWTLGVDVYRRWEDPDRRHLSAFLSLLGGSAVVVAVVGVVAPEVVLGTATNDRGLLYSLAWPVTAAAFPWGVFVLRYTGRGEMVLSSRWQTATVATVVTCGFAWPSVSQFVSVAGAPSELTAPAILVLVTLFPLTWFLFVGGALVALLWTTHRYDYLGRVHRVSLGLAPFPPAVTLVAGLQLLDSTPAVAVATVVAGFGLAACLVGLSVYRYGVLEASPAAGNIGRDAVVAELTDPLVLVDEDGQVVDANPAAKSTLGVDADELPEVSLSTVLGVDFGTVRSRDVLELRTTKGRRRYDVQLSTLSDATGEAAGYAVTLRDVTERAIRDQRLAVLNRVLRHNLRNKLTVARGVAEMSVEGDVPPPSVAEDFAEATDELLGLGEKAREVERRMENVRVDDDPVELRPVADSVVERIRAEFPAATVDVDVPEGLGVRGDPELLTDVLSNLVENGVVHGDGDPEVVVRAARTPGEKLPVCVSVEDDGPGIPDHEREVIEEGTETALEHGSGLGLWVAKWGTMRLGGEIRFRDTTDGTVVELLFPEE